MLSRTSAHSLVNACNTSTTLSIDARQSIYNQVVALVLCWYIVSSISNNLSKQILSTIATPFTLTYVQVRAILPKIPLNRTPTDHDRSVSVSGSWRVC